MRLGKWGNYPAQHRDLPYVVSFFLLVPYSAPTNELVKCLSGGKLPPEVNFQQVTKGN